LTRLAGSRAIAILAWLSLAVPANPGAQSTITVDREQLLHDLRVLSSDDMQGREVGTAGGAKARAYIVERFRAVGIQPIAGAYERPFPVAGGRTRVAATGVNVVGMIRGTRTPDRFIVVSAHYDHVGIRNGETFNGADDNASGTAALFAIGAHFSKMPPAVSLMVVAFDGEERGNVGSRAFLQQPPADRNALLLNLNADMIGRDPDNVLWVSGASRVPALKPIVDRVAARAPVQVRTGRDDGGREDWMAQSDQWSFIEMGIPALYVGVTDEAHHHRPTDDYANMTHDFYVRAVATIVDLIDSLASAPDILSNLRPAPGPSVGSER
jgi:hypothetical protein